MAPNLGNADKARHRVSGWMKSLTWMDACRAVLRIVALTGMALGMLAIAAWLTPVPSQFVLGEDLLGVSAPSYQEWHLLSDWLHGRKFVVLTFDDGPTGDGMDERFLAILRKHHAHAMFFLVCNRINEKTSPVLHRIESEGHTIGNHSLDHLHLRDLPSDQVFHQIDACSSRIASVTGHRPYYFRPPFGNSSPEVEHIAEAAGAHPIFWNASSDDYKLREPEVIVQRSLDEATDMSILLMHERKVTERALDEILTRLEKQGYVFVLPSERGR
ncbi:polysaccharide deacetylase family protein [Dyella halodurans]|uniref:Polysaccharide deacetylase family protein n=1 Tax=Dyella halodurans TaxID=1920171 RepID=A0ABV9C634_9GAMM|nr:polysaccharide deacetylase family protein [Dyella halodurans]